MDAAELQIFLTQPEGPTLDFKSKWYHLDAPEPGGRYQRDELVRDVLALANGSTSVAGAEAHLIIGAGDHISPEGRRELFDAIDFSPDGLASRITQMVNAACSPAIGGLDFTVVPVEGCRVGVLTVHASPLLHETTRNLDPCGKSVTKHVVFLRSGDTTEVASYAEREAVAVLKRRRFNELRKVSPAVFGAILGAFLGASAGVASSQFETPVSRLAGLLAGAVVFSGVGLLLGVVTQRSLWIKRDWRNIPLPVQVAIVVALGGGALWLALGFYGRVMG